jgi:hypothetical protein
VAASGRVTGLVMATATTQPSSLPSLGGAELSSPSIVVVIRQGESSSVSIYRRAASFGRCSSAAAFDCVIDGVDWGNCSVGTISTSRATKAAIEIGMAACSEW